MLTAGLSLRGIMATSVLDGALDGLDEATRPLADELVSPVRALKLARDAGADDLTVANVVASRREDMLAHHALGILNHARSAATLSLAMERDVRALFGSRRELADAATRYLLALSDVIHVKRLCAEVVERGLGAWDERRRLVFRGALMSEMPGALRYYVGCASYLSGEPDGLFLVRIDSRARKLKFFLVERERTSFPSVTSSIAVDLKRQDVRMSHEARRLVRKSVVYGGPSARQLAVERRRAKEMGGVEGTMFEDVVDRSRR